MEEIIYLNGKFIAKSQAQISPFDRGFLFGDAIYDGVPIYNNRAFLIAEHYQRLTNNLKAANINQPLTYNEFTRITSKLAKQTFCPKHYGIYWQISRGTQSNRQHNYTADIKPTVFACIQAVTKPILAEYESGFKAIISADLRWLKPEIKSCSLLANVMHSHQASQAQAKECILTNNDYFTEGASSNLFIVQNNELFTPTTNSNILPGITRSHVINLATQSGIKVNETNCHISMLDTCSEVFITGAYKEIMPITQIDNISIGTGKTGAIWRVLFNKYQASIHKLSTQLLPCTATL